MGLSDYLVSVLRTVVPAGVGTFVAYMTGLTGTTVDDGASATVASVLTALSVGLYYLVVRALESRYPRLGWMLGAPRPPIYTKPE